MKTIKRIIPVLVVTLSASLAQATIDGLHKTTVDGLHAPEKIDTTLLNLDQNTKPITSTIADYVERFKQNKDRWAADFKTKYKDQLDQLQATTDEYKQKYEEYKKSGKLDEQWQEIKTSLQDLATQVKTKVQELWDKL